MSSKKFGFFFTIMIGISMIMLGWTYDRKFSFVVSGLGIALVGISLETYLKNKKDTTTKDGRSRNDIDLHDERTILVNAKSGETVNYIMDFCTVIAFIVAKLLNVSLAGMIIILSLMIIRLIASSAAKSYYENRV